MVQVTKHSEKRSKERCGLNKNSTSRMAEKAFKNGVCHSETSGNLRRWMDKLYLSHKVANNTKLYGDKAYLFKGNMLITIIQIPNNLLDTALKLQRSNNERPK